MEGKLKVSILTVSRRVFEGEGDSLYAPGDLGEFGILPGHAAMIAGLTVGIVRIHREGGTVRLAVRGGVVKVEGDMVSLMVDEAVTQDEVRSDDTELRSARIESMLSSGNITQEGREALCQERRWVAVLESLAGD